VVHSDRPKHAYLSPMPDSRIRPRRGFAAGGDGVWGTEPVLYRAPERGRSTIYLIIIILFISFLRTLLLSPFVLVWLRLRKDVYRVSEGGVSARGRLGI
jgi:hypothetical protein